MRTIYVITASARYGGSKRLIRAFYTEADARRAVEMIDCCDPAATLDIEEVEIEGDIAAVPAPNYPPVWRPHWQWQWPSNYPVAFESNFSMVDERL